MAEILVYAGFAVGVGIVIWVLVRIVLDMAATAVNRDEGIHAFCRSFDGSQFQGREEREGRHGQEVG